MDRVPVLAHGGQGVPQQLAGLTGAVALRVALEEVAERLAGLGVPLVSHRLQGVGQQIELPRARGPRVRGARQGVDVDGGHAGITPGGRTPTSGIVPTGRVAALPRALRALDLRAGIVVLGGDWRLDAQVLLDGHEPEVHVGEPVVHVVVEGLGGLQLAPEHLELARQSLDRFHQALGGGVGLGDVPPGQGGPIVDLVQATPLAVHLVPDLFDRDPVGLHVADHHRGAAAARPVQDTSGCQERGDHQGEGEVSHGSGPALRRRGGDHSAISSVRRFLDQFTSPAPSVSGFSSP